MNSRDQLYQVLLRCDEMKEKLRARTLFLAIAIALNLIGIALTIYVTVKNI